jgi:hypothetical protein
MENGGRKPENGTFKIPFQSLLFIKAEIQIITYQCRLVKKFTLYSH